MHIDKNKKLTSPSEMHRYIEDILLNADHDFLTEVRKKEDAVQRLQTKIGEGNSVKLSAAIAEEDQSMGKHLLLLYWLGMLQNYRCYVNPSEKDFLDLDYEQIHQEAALNLLLDAGMSGLAAHNFFYEAGEAEVNQILSFYGYLETIGYKLAHYLGFRYADDFLQRLVCDYKPDAGITNRYRSMVMEDTNTNNLP